MAAAAKYNRIIVELVSLFGFKSRVHWTCSYLTAPNKER